MKTMTFLSTFILLVLFSCSENNDTNIFTGETGDSTINNRQAIPHIGTTWLFGRSSMILGGGCFAMGSCEPLDFPGDFLHFGTYENVLGTPVIFTLLSSNELHVEILNASTTIEEIQEILDANPETNNTAENIYNTMTSSVPVEESMSLGLELSQQLVPSSNDLIILPGDYIIDYSNSEFGEFTVVIEQL